MFKKIFNYGSSQGIIIPKAWLNLLNWNIETMVKLDFDYTNKQIIIKEK